MNPSPKTLIEQNPMTGVQYATIFICFLMNIFDGMDVMVISYSAPAIAKSWGISPKELGAVFSAGLFGMTLGTLFLAPLADKIGRKTIILISGAIMGVFMYLTAYATDVTDLVIYRFISGLGIGSMLASTSTLASEYTPLKTRNFWISTVVAGYPVGAVLSGLVAAKVIPSEGWQTMFKIAGVASALSVPLVLLFLSESIDFYLNAQPKNALQKLNIILQKLNIDPIETLPVLIAKKAGLPVGELLKTEYKKPTIQLWLALFTSFAALYFLTLWIPKMTSDLGLPQNLAIYAGTLFNVGAFFGIITQGYFSNRYGLKKTIGVILILTAVLMASFGLFLGSDYAILIAFTGMGFGIQGGFVGLYAVSARMYPAEFRTTGVGWAMGAGRFGAIIGPYLAGYLIQSGVSISINFIVFAVFSLLAGLITMKISSKQIY
ncbi:MAG: MFS transporter [Spirosomaceae bacterium]|nr:MFS transporter [Spirosomataceae bacterium]